MVFLLVSLCCDTVPAMVFLLVSLCCTALAMVFLLVSLCCDTALAKVNPASRQNATLYRSAKRSFLQATVICVQPGRTHFMDGGLRCVCSFPKGAVSSVSLTPGRKKSTSHCEICNTQWFRVPLTRRHHVATQIRYRLSLLLFDQFCLGFGV